MALGHCPFAPWQLISVLFHGAFYNCYYCGYIFLPHRVDLNRKKITVVMCCWVLFCFVFNKEVCMCAFWDCDWICSVEGLSESQGTIGSSGCFSAHLSLHRTFSDAMKHQTRKFLCSSWEQTPEFAILTTPSLVTTSAHSFLLFLYLSITEHGPRALSTQADNVPVAIPHFGF